ncbi:basic amino acid ABC transporter substrate-binding protein [Salirhabdus sp. Marseille-P4669]|uniref:basic amino acid ABC transporter substrate-binding protein n=1 Tax=Salirhabdus sp. Marseille-P4669 TaxID=2042310 RepID=UPI000C796040|nr:basic amino acid ABC transporter substrate-binding protein [Salirhabdus sp. Marseille-P4669]
MKKRLILLFAIAMTALVACGSDDASGDGDSDAKELKVVTDAAFAPFEYLEGEEVVGFDADLGKAVLEEAGYTMNFEHVGWENMLLQTEQGEADLAIAGISITDDRKKTYDFSNPYFVSTQMILVPEDSEVTSVEDLKDKTVGVQISTTGDNEASRIFGENSSQIKKYEQVPLAIMAMQSGDVDAVIVDNVVAQEYMKTNPDAGVKGVYDEDSFEVEYYGFMFPKDSKLAGELNEALQEVMDNGTYSEIYKEWFGQEPDLAQLQ